MKKYQLWSALIIAGVLPASYVVLKLGYDPTSVYWLNLIFCVLLFIVCMKLLKDIFPFSILEYTKSVILPCIIIALGVLMGLSLLHFCFGQSWIRFILTILSSITSTFLISYFVALNRQEKDFVIRFIKKKIGR